MKRNAFHATTLSFLVLVLFLCADSFAVEAPESQESKQLVAMVDKAAAMIGSKGKDFFPELRKKDGPWRSGELYVFVDGMDGKVLVHPPDPSIEGLDLLKDPSSKAVIELLLDAAKAKESGWVEYMWPKPGETTPSKKMSYIRRVKMPDGVLVIVGAGMYAE
jgi:cytochrome c